MRKRLKTRLCQSHEPVERSAIALCTDYHCSACATEGGASAMASTHVGVRRRPVQALLWLRMEQGKAAA